MSKPTHTHAHTHLQHLLHQPHISSKTQKSNCKVVFPHQAH